MENVKVNLLAERTLDAIRKSGASEKTIRGYARQWFPEIVQHFDDSSENVYSKKVADTLVTQTRRLYEDGAIKRMQWQMIRRGVELLDWFYRTGDVAMGHVRRWDALHNPLHGNPLPDDFKENNNLRVLVYFTKQELGRINVGSRAIDNYLYSGFDKILRHCAELGITIYDQDAMGRFVVAARAQFDAGVIGRCAYQTIRKSVALLDEYYQTGRIKWGRLSPWGLRELNTAFAHALQLFLEEITQAGQYASNTVKIARSSVRCFLFELENNGHSNFEHVTPRTISECITAFAKNHPGRIRSCLLPIRQFLLFLYDCGMTTGNLSIAVPEIIAPRRAIREGFRADEMALLLNAADSDDVLGKRDYAIMMSAVQTGLRASDIINLKFQDIDWRNNEIRVVQQKTGRPLCLPLEAETGNAIAEYLLKGRPSCDSPFIFLCKDKPYRPLTIIAASRIIARRMRQAGIGETGIPRRGFHSFRRSFGVELLESDIPLDMLGELLGHTRMDSVKPYLAINETGLKSCALGLALTNEGGMPK